MYRFWMLCCLWALVLPAAIAEPLLLNEQFSRLILGPEVKVLSEEGAGYDLVEVLALPDGAFQPWEEEIFRFGYTSSAHWLKLELDHAGEGPRRLIIELVNPYLYEFHFHELRDGQLIASDTIGTRFPFSRRREMAHSPELPHRNFQFAVQLQPGEHGTYYLYFPPSGYHLNFDLYLWEENYRNTWQQRFEDYILTSFFLLCVVYLMILGIAIYITKFNYYWYYFLYVFLGSLLVFSDLGLSYRYLWGQSSYFQQIALVIIANLYLIFGTLFIREHFETRNNYRIIDHVLRVIKIISVIIIPLSFLTPGIEQFSFFYGLATFQNLLIIMACITFFYLLFVSIYSPSKTFSGLFLIGFSLHGISLIIASLQDVGIIAGGIMPAYLMKMGYPVTFYTQVTLMVGMLLEMVFVFYIAIKRFRKIYSENNQMLRDLAMQRQQNMDALVLGIEGERKRIAQDLHDGLGVMLSSVKMRLDVFKEKVGAANGTAEELEEIIKDIDHSHEEVRSISHNLMPKSLHKLGFEAAIEEQLHRLEALDNGVKVNFYKNISLQQASEQAQAYLFRIVQELLNNVLKHAKATEINLQFIRHEEQLLITLEDNGVGFEHTQSSGKGIGIENVRHRVSALGGHLLIDSKPGSGTLVSIELPLASLSGAS
ncbi:MAG: 7TM-DISM domain-containing protein [Bacteroidota bacterium]